MKMLGALLRENRVFALILLVGLSIRLFLITLIPFRTDMQSWFGWGQQLVEFGIFDFYERTSWTDYTPGFFYILWIVSLLRYWIFADLDGVPVETLYKLIPVIGDLGVAVILYLILKQARHSYQRWNHWIAGVYLFSPFTILTGAIWGQVESVSVFFVLAAWYFWQRQRYYASVMAFTTACVIKPLIGLFSPGFVVLFLLGNKTKLGQSVVIALVTFMALTIPFWGVAAPLRLMEQLNSSYATYPASSINALNYWAIFGLWQNDQTIYLGVAQHTWATLGTLLLILIMATITYLKARGFEREVLWKLSLGVASVSALVGYTFLSRMHERYLYQFFPFFLIAVLLLAKKIRDLQIGVVLWLALMILHTFNLYYVYIQYLYLPEAVPVEYEFFYFIYERISLWGIFQTVLCLLAYVYVYYLININTQKEMK
ncbi:MAG: hypothetical protein KatS3mg087_0680 [Patescibacteria group bacterium]|nr:MAG: hypothetical protein KatS3mg087_0680 [Patescibacteria group bacterium]